MWRQRSILGWRQEHVEFEASLGYPARLCLKTKRSWDLNNSHSGRTCCCLLSFPRSHLACLEHSKLASSIVGASSGSVHLQPTPPGLQERTWDQALKRVCLSSATIQMKR